MTLFSKAAVLAVRSCQADQKKTPVVAWEEAIAKCSTSRGTRAKVCPREAFLGLCEKRLVTGILADVHANDGENRKYAVCAVMLLRKEPVLANDKHELWRRVVGPAKAPNGQMDVVLALWREGMLRKT